MAGRRIRSCVGCRRSGPKEGFIRIVRQPGNGAIIDLTGKKPGRGAYLCRSEACLNKALKATRLSRALKTSIDEGVLENLKQVVAQDTGLR